MTDKRTGKLMVQSAQGVSPGHELWPYMEQSVNERAATMGGKITGYQGSHDEWVPELECYRRLHFWTMEEL